MYCLYAYDDTPLPTPHWAPSGVRSGFYYDGFFGDRCGSLVETVDVFLETVARANGEILVGYGGLLSYCTDIYVYRYTPA